MSRSDARELASQVKIPEVDKERLAAKLEMRYGAGRAGHFAHYMAHVAGSNHRFKPSDVMDLAQMCYAYDCDFFRCDNAMADIFKGFAPFEGKLFSSLNDLLAQVRSTNLP
jgi:hypothetical protein